MPTKLLVIQGDIAQLRVDAIVRNSKGRTAISGARELPARYVIDAEGPLWTGGESREEDRLGKAYQDALTLAVQHKVRTIAFPNISTGRYGYPKSKAARVALTTVRNFLKAWPGSFQEVIFACWDSENYHLYKEMLGSENLVVHT
jgi:O-acetyl-ADP-ribose deacetylase (regulator of RNase III)